MSYEHKFAVKIFRNEKFSMIKKKARIISQFKL